MGVLDELDDRQLFASRIPHAASAPSAVKLFLSRRFSRVSSATTSFRADASRRRSLTSSEVAARAVSPASRFLAGFEKILRPAIIQVLDDPLTTAELCDALLAAQALQFDVKSGDKILFGKWSGTEVKIDGQDLLIMKESDILGVVA